MNDPANSQVVLAVTSDLVLPSGELTFPDYPLDMLISDRRLMLKRIDVSAGHAPADMRNVDLLVSIPHGAPVTADALAEAGRLVAVLRVGVGYEDCDVEALTRAAIALVVPSSATQRPTAVAALTLILAVVTRLLEKHRLTLAGPSAWPRRADLRSRDLRGKRLGLVGCGTIGRELIAIARPLGFIFLVHDPALTATAAAALGAELLPIDDVMRSSDIVSIHCPLNAMTRGLIDARRLALMKSEAFLINTARGDVVDQAALTTALSERRIAGAGLDVFSEEPMRADDPLLHLDNVVLSAHALNWTRELDADLGRANAGAAAALLAGEVPEGIVNREVIDDPRFIAKLTALKREVARRETPALTKA